MNTQTPTSVEANSNMVCGQIVTLGACERILAAMEQARNGVKARFETLRENHEHMLQLALNEAEALAWQTSYPHLLFPTLAEEKALAVNTWAVRQNALRQGRKLSAVAA